MRFHNLLVLAVLAFFLKSCGDNNNNENLFSVEISNSKKSYKNSDELTVGIGNKKNKTIDSVIFLLDKNRVSSQGGNSQAQISLANQKLGKRTVSVQVFSEGEMFEANKEVTLLASKKPKLYTYNILEVFPHDITAYTQGLEFANDTLYESTGLYGKSTLRKTNYITGEVLVNLPLGDQYFGEGLTIANDKIYQLTWREKAGLIYDLNTMEKTGSFFYNESKEGWGLCNDGQNIYKSDGTEKIWTLNQNTLAEEDYIQIYTHTSKIDNVNELEWVDGKIYANIYEQGSIAIVNPDNGAVEGVINLKGLKGEVTQHDELNVLNGIAYKGEPNILYITGKNWDKLFKIEVVE